MHDRRGGSLDISRPLTNYHVAAVLENKKARRSSFPRLAMPSWRTGPASSPGSSRSGKQLEDEQDVVELQTGHGTPFSANGLRGGFAPDEGSLYSSRGSSIRSASIRSSFYNGDDAEQEDDGEGASLDTGHSSRTRVFVSPGLTPVDSGFADFGPDSVVPQAEEAKEMPPSPGVSKRRSKGWFSFSNPVKEEADEAVVEAPRESVAHSSVSTPLKKSRLGFNITGRKRGDSEVSMKDIVDL